MKTVSGQEYLHIAKPLIIYHSVEALISYLFHFFFFKSLKSNQVNQEIPDTHRLYNAGEVVFFFKNNKISINQPMLVEFSVTKKVKPLFSWEVNCGTGILLCRCRSIEGTYWVTILQEKKKEFRLSSEWHLHLTKLPTKHLGKVPDSRDFFFYNIRVHLWSWSVIDTRKYGSFKNERKFNEKLIPSLYITKLILIIKKVVYLFNTYKILIGLKYIVNYKLCPNKCNPPPKKK